MATVTDRGNSKSSVVRGTVMSCTTVVGNGKDSVELSVMKASDEVTSKNTDCDKKGSNSSVKGM